MSPTSGTPTDILILACVVFNPGDLYYLGYKKIMIIIIIDISHKLCTVKLSPRSR